MKTFAEQWQQAEKAKAEEVKLYVRLEAVEAMFIELLARLAKLESRVTRVEE